MSRTTSSPAASPTARLPRTPSPASQPSATVRRSSSSTRSSGAADDSTAAPSPATSPDRSSSRASPASDAASVTTSRWTGPRGRHHRPWRRLLERPHLLADAAPRVRLHGLALFCRRHPLAAEQFRRWPRRSLGYPSTSRSFPLRRWCAMSSGDEQDVETDVPAFRIAVVVELTPREEFRTAEARDPTALPVQRTTFDETLAKLVPPFTIDVDDPFGGAPLPIDLRWQALRELRATDSSTRRRSLGVARGEARLERRRLRQARPRRGARAPGACASPAEGWGGVADRRSRAFPRAGRAGGDHTRSVKPRRVARQGGPHDSRGEPRRRFDFVSLLSAVTKSSRPKAAAPAGATANVDAAFVRVLSSISYSTTRSAAWSASGAA